MCDNPSKSCKDSTSILIDIISQNNTAAHRDQPVMHPPLRLPAPSQLQKPKDIEMCPPLLRLPTELLISVVQNVMSLGDLCAFRDTSRLFRDIIPNTSFKSLRLERTSRDANALGRVMTSGEFCDVVNHISLDYNVGEDFDEGAWCRKRGESMVSPLMIETDGLLKIFMSAFLRISRAPSLKSLRLTFSHTIETKPVPHLEELFTYPIAFQQRLLTVVARAAPPMLSTLILENVAPIPHSVYTSHNFACLMERLTTFSLSTAGGSSKGTSPLFSNTFADFWYTTIPSVLSRARNLECLALRSGGCEEGFVPIEVGIRCLWFPRLRSLALQNISFGLGLKSMAECRMEDFIARHGATLERLDLDGSFLWTIGSMPRVTWAGMFDRFAESLQCLREIVPWVRDYSLEGSEGCLVRVDACLMQEYDSFRYSKERVPWSITREDRTALQRLITVTQERVENHIASLL